MKRIPLLIVFTLVFSLGTKMLSAETVAFGYFVNRSGNENYDYLENVLPKSFASTLKNRYKFSILRPDSLGAVYENNEAVNNKTLITINEKELPELSDSISAGYLVFGSFTTTENNQVKLRVSIYKTGTKFIFTFDETGQLETDLFRLVDRIALRINNFIQDPMAFKIEAVKAKSKIAVISNIQGEELNSLYYEFMASGFRLSMIQGNELYTYITDENIQKFYQIQAGNASYDIIGRTDQVDIFHGTWSGKEYYKKIIQERDVFKKYCDGFLKQNDAWLEKMSGFDQDLDYLIIIGFDEDREIAWYRCIEIKSNRLISFEYGFEGGSVNEIVKKIITGLTTPPAVKN